MRGRNIRLNRLTGVYLFIYFLEEHIFVIVQKEHIIENLLVYKQEMGVFCFGYIHFRKPSAQLMANWQLTGSKPYP